MNYKMDRIDTEYRSYIFLKNKQFNFERNGNMRRAFLTNFDALYRLITIYMWTYTSYTQLNHPLAQKIIVEEAGVTDEFNWRRIYKHRCNIKYNSEQPVSESIFLQLKHTESEILTILREQITFHKTV
ncbi:MAG: hypothetical protein Kow00108_19630 [Calditrichia bacterium]